MKYVKPLNLGVGAQVVKVAVAAKGVAVAAGLARQAGQLKTRSQVRLEYDAYMERIHEHYLSS